MKIIRVLVYEGTEEKLKADLQRRGVKGSRIYGPRNELTITERFAGDDLATRLWLGEQASEQDALVGAAASLEGMYAVACPICGAQAGELCHVIRGEGAVGAALIHQDTRINAARVASALRGQQ